MYDKILAYTDQFQSIIEEEYEKCLIDRDCCSLSSSAYARLNGNMEFIQIFVLPNIITLKDLILNMNDKYLEKCAETGIEPVKDTSFTIEDFKVKPIDITTMQEISNSENSKELDEADEEDNEEDEE